MDEGEGNMEPELRKLIDFSRGKWGCSAIAFSAINRGWLKRGKGDTEGEGRKEESHEKRREQIGFLVFIGGNKFMCWN